MDQGISQKLLAQILLALPDAELGRVVRKALTSSSPPRLFDGLGDDAADPSTLRPATPLPYELVHIEGVGDLEVCEEHGTRFLLVAKSSTQAGHVVLLCSACPFQLERPLDADLFPPLAAFIEAERKRPIPRDLPTR